MDYQSNAKKSKSEQKPEKVIEKVISTEVIVQKKSLGRKFRDTFIKADFKSVARYVIGEVLLPAARNMIVDASTKGIERMMHGEAATRRRGIDYSGGPRITYNSPINRGYRNSPRYAPSIDTRSRRDGNDIILSSRDEAELVLERMNDIIDNYGIASVSDLNDLMGLPTTHTDEKWGWEYLGNCQVRQIREGYLLDLPPSDPIG